MVRTLALIGSLLFLASSAVAQDESEKDFKKMAGDWVPVLMQIGGKKQPEAVLKTVTLSIAGNKYNRVVGKEKDEGTLKIDTAKTPRELDITPGVGPNKGKLIPCIYEIKEDELTVCYGLAGTRPADFKAGEDAKGVMLMTYKRAPKSKP